MSKKIFITGGAGFIGSHIVENLLNDGHQVTVYDNFSSGRKENLKSVIKDIKLIEADILDYENLNESMKGHDIVSHQAAQLEIFKCLEDPIVDLQTNTVGTLNIFRAAAENGIKKVINASSACVYGQAQYTPQDEDHPKNPNWPYGVSKLAAEKYAYIYHKNNGIDIANLRYGIVYGEREWQGRVLTMFLTRILKNKSPVIFGNGEQLRDFIYVKDAAKLNSLLITKDFSGYKTFNVSTGIGTSVKDLAGLVIKASGTDLKPLFEDVLEGESSAFMPERKRIPAELEKMVLSPNRAKEDLGWIPEVTVEEGVKKEYDWIKENQGFWPDSKEIKV